MMMLESDNMSGNTQKNSLTPHMMVLESKNLHHAHTRKIFTTQETHCNA
ncbi:MAG: hypothetical protein IJU26_05900 [Synergistaceae bacterium]|nr:hypothetical protein [Synergistaceae bacterium]